MKVSTVIVTYNRLNLLKQCIDKVLNQDVKDLDIVLVDNASNDGTKEYIEGLNNERIKYFNTGKNLGGAGGFSFGLNAASKAGYDYCWIMDDDTMVNHNSLYSLLDKMIKTNSAYICSRVLWTDGKACTMNTPPNGKWKCLYDEEALDLHLIEIQGCSFVSCLVNMKHVREAGLPIADFFIYGDDIEFTRRLQKYSKGYLDLDSVVTHAMPGNNTATIINCEKERVERYKYGVRNNIYIMRHHDGKHFFGIMAYMIKMSGAIILRSPDSKGKRLSVLIGSTFKGLFFNPEIKMPEISNGECV